MSRSTNDPTTSQETRQSTPVPRAVIHKQILDAAQDRPAAAMSELADAVNGASVDLVEQVLEEYGDPAADEPSAGDPETADDPEADGDSWGGPDGDPESMVGRDSDPEPEDGGDGTPGSPEAGEAASPGHGERKSAADGGATIETDREPTESDRREAPAADGRSDSTSDSPIDPDSLSETERRTLRAIRERPNATQQELADRFDVTAATINRRVNDIDGFEWSNREAIVADLFPDDGPDGRELDVDPTEPEPNNDSAEAEPDAVPTGPAPDEGSQRRDSEAEYATSGPDAAASQGESTTAGADGTTDRRDSGADPTQPEPADSRNPGSGAEPAECDAESAQLEALSARIDALTESVASLDRRLDASGDGSRSGLEDPELIAKAMHACLQSERISESEELRLLETFVADD
ncbi:winged helix-turn-helix transcriptional regulator [Halovivax limisalsi]|uniref:winged helix-turn-helix transcriptional regulator n=1 Tax=Halovivax limisalsi TaxID=1453760 RepID=UPI001FFCE1E4|nr:winged helix-turn-helix transcriptional regulator [Halovivax limisalsi]